jgi:hypothetical protein
MADGACLQLAVALRCDGDTIHGTVDDRAGEVVEFSGWLELMSAFDVVCARASGPRALDERSRLGDGH